MIPHRSPQSIFICERSSKKGHYLVQTTRMIRDLEDTVAKLTNIIETQRKMLNGLELASHTSKN